MMSDGDALWLGVVEGFTEYLPVSSTGHLILMSRWLGHEGEASAAFDIVIQLGAILAVLVHYRKLLSARLSGLLKRDPVAEQLFGALLIAFMPAAVFGLLLRKTIKALLFGPVPVAIALILGGFVMLFVERLRGGAGSTSPVGEVGLEKVSYTRAFGIGIAQCAALWPGMSRSMSTIVGGQLMGLSTATAAEFSFLLGLPTLGAATLYEAYKSRDVLLMDGGARTLAIGLVVSFGVAWLVIAAFIRYLSHRGLSPFGWYRIILGVAVAGLALRA
jgi:undecaprenyl-diphosphatase